MDRNNVEKVMEEMLFNLIKTLSAVFDEHGGKLIVDKETFEKSQLGFYVKYEEANGKVILTKEVGKSPLYHDIFGKEN